MANWLVVGAGGMFGTDLVETLRRSAHDVTAWDRSDIDITDDDRVRDRVTGFDVVVNAAAWTAVDAAETHESQAFTVNAVGPANLARACGRTGATLVQLSTDYVFDGRASQPYPVDAPLRPQSAYGRSKAAGEWAVAAHCERHYIVRTAYLYGEHGPNLVKTMARLAGRDETVRVVTDQQIQPTWTVDLAAGVQRLVDAAAPYGAWHGTGGGSTTVFDFARAIFADLGVDPALVQPTTMAEYPTPTPRPAYSVLSHQRWTDAGIEPLPQWRGSLDSYLASARAEIAR